MVSPTTFYRNNGNGTFTRITAASVVNDIPSGIRSLACVWGDYDNDGFLDLFVSTCSPSALVKQLLYHNNGDGTFTRVLTGSLVNDPGCSQAAIWGDYDNDGFLDLFVTHGALWARSQGGALLNNFLYRNNGNSNRWLTVRLIGTLSNRSAIGAKVRVRATIRGQSTWQLRQILAGESQANQQPLDAHFGLGDATNIDLVRIEWPSGTVQELRDVAVNQFLTVTEPPRLSSAELSDGVFGFTLKGGRGLQYRIQSSSNLLDWMQAGSVTITNFAGTARFSEPVDTNESTRVFRVVTQ
jgi:hypothetical protein